MAAGGRNYVIYVPAAHQKSRIRHPHLPMPLAIAIEHIINIYADSCLFFYTHTRKLCNYLCLPRLLKLFSLPFPPPFTCRRFSLPWKTFVYVYTHECINYEAWFL